MLFQSSYSTNRSSNDTTSLSRVRLNFERSQSERSIATSDKTGNFFEAARKTVVKEQITPPIELLKEEFERLRSSELSIKTRIIDSEAELLGKWFDLF